MGHEVHEDIMYSILLVRCPDAGCGFYLIVLLMVSLKDHYLHMVTAALIHTMCVS